VIKLLKEGKADEKIQDFQAKNLEDTFKMLFADLEYLKKNEKEISSLDKEQVQSMFNDVKTMYITALDIIQRTSVMKVKYIH